jgi:hypothetical protein
MIAPHIRSLTDQDGAVLLDLRRDKMLTLNSTGGYIWERLRAGELVDDIIRDLSYETGMPSVVVERDVQEFLEGLKSRHILVETVHQQLHGRHRRLPDCL